MDDFTKGDLIYLGWIVGAVVLMATILAVFAWLTTY